MVWKRIINSQRQKKKEAVQAQTTALNSEILKEYLEQLSEDWNFEQCRNAEKDWNKEQNLWQPGSILWVEATEITEFIPCPEKRKWEKIHSFWEGIRKKKGR